MTYKTCFLSPPLYIYCLQILIKWTRDKSNTAGYFHFVVISEIYTHLWHFTQKQLSLFISLSKWMDHGVITTYQTSHIFSDLEI